MRLWRLIRSLFLLVAVVALGYTGWIFIDEYWHQREESQAFDSARQAQPKRPSQKKSQPLPAGPMRARLRIERLGLTTMVEEGVDSSVLRRSAGHIPGTAIPGQPGNVGVAAHRDAQFRSLSGIRKRDQIQLATVDRDYKYEVISTKIVNPEDVSVLAPLKNQNTLTLVTCYPFYFVGHAPKRFIVLARQVGSADLPSDIHASDLAPIPPKLSRPAYPKASARTKRRSSTRPEKPLVRYSRTVRQPLRERSQ